MNLEGNFAAQLQCRSASPQGLWEQVTAVSLKPVPKLVPHSGDQCRELQRQEGRISGPTEMSTQATRGRHRQPVTPLSNLLPNFMSSR